MKYFVIYENSKFIGFTDDKELLDIFINTRKGEYEYIKIKEKDLPQYIKSMSIFHDYMLIKYISYYSNNSVVFFNYEAFSMEYSMSEDCIVLETLLRNILKYSKYLKLTEDEYQIIQISFRKLITDLECVTNGHEVIYDEIIDIDKYFNNRYLTDIKKSYHNR